MAVSLSLRLTVTLPTSLSNDGTELGLRCQSPEVNVKLSKQYVSRKEFHDVYKL